MAIYPYNYVNRRGIPLVESTSVTVGTDSVVFSFAPHAFAGVWGKGLVLIHLAQPIAEGTTGTLPIVLSTNGVEQAVTSTGGGAVTVADFTGAGIYLFYYDKASYTLQQMTGVV